MKLVLGVIAIVCAVALGWWLWSDNFNPTPNSMPNATRVTKVGDRAVSVAIGETLLLERVNGDICAVRFDEVTSNHGANYTVKFIPSQRSEKHLGKYPSIHGRVFEKYWRTRTGHSSYFVIKIGGDYKIECGEIGIPWSSSTWIYFRSGDRFAVVSDVDMDSVNISNLGIKWNVYKD